MTYCFKAQGKEKGEQLYYTASVGNIKIICRGFSVTHSLHKHPAPTAPIFFQLQTHQWVKMGNKVENQPDSESVFLMVLCSVRPVCEFGKCCSTTQTLCKLSKSITLKTREKYFIGQLGIIFVNLRGFSLFVLLCFCFSKEKLHSLCSISSQSPNSKT